MTTTQAPSTDTTATVDPVSDVHSRLIDHWFPCSSVDASVGTTAGSGRSEKALFTWFASRPIAQARAAVLTTLLPDRDDLHGDVRLAIEAGSSAALGRLREAIAEEYPTGRPVVLDMFSGRGIIPLEAARLGVTAVGTDLSPVATLGGRLLADYPLRDWSAEAVVPFASGAEPEGKLFSDDEPRLLRDVRAVLAEVNKRVAKAVAPYYLADSLGKVPWAYLWAVSIPCDQCRSALPAHRRHAAAVSLRA